MKPSVLGVLAIAACGCRDTAPAKREASPPQSSNFATALKDIGADNVATIASPGTKLTLDTVVGIVGIDAKSSFTIHRSTYEPPDTSGMSKGMNMTMMPGTVTLESLTEALKLPPVARRQPSAFGAVDAPQQGSAEPISAMDELFARLGHPEPSTGVPTPLTRRTTAMAITHPYEVSAGVIVFADAKAPAGTLVDVLAKTGGFIAVKTRAPQPTSPYAALPFAFDRQPPPWVAPTRSWVELRLGKTIELEAMRSDTTVIPSLDKVGEVVRRKGVTAIDVLVDEPTTVAELVGVLDQLRAANIDAVGLGRVPTPNSPEAAARLATGPRVLAWDFFMQGQDKNDVSTFRAALDSALQAIHVCYGEALKKTPDLAGTARVELIVPPDGKVKELQAAGVAPPLATCATTALRGVTFPAAPAAAKITAQLAFVPR